MRNYVIINGVNSLTIQGLAIKTMPPITKPIQRTLREEIDGRDGDLVTELGYGAYDKTIEIGLFGTFNIDEVIAFFNQKGTITFSNEADKVYNFQALEQVDYAELLKFRTANVVLHCQPFKYPTEETPLEEEYEYVTGTGTDITLDNTEETEFNEIELQGNTSQVTYTGKNLFSGNISQFDNQGGEGTTYTYFKLDENKTYTLSATAKDNITVATNHYIGMTYNGGNATGSYTWLISQGQTFTKGQKATLTSNQNRRFISAYSTTQANLDYLMENFDIMLEESATATDFEPYVGGIPAPNPQFPQPVQVVSGENNIEISNKNLLDINNWQWRYIDSGGTNKSDSSHTNALFDQYIAVKPNTQYYISVKNTIYNMGVSEFTKDETFIKRNQISANIQGGSITTTNDTYLLRVSVNYNSSSEVTQEILEGLEIQLEAGNQRTTYVEHKGHIYKINLSSHNLFDKSSATFKDGYYLNASGEETYNSAYTYLTSYIPVKPNKQYSLQGTLWNVIGAGRIYFFDSNQTWLSRSSSSYSQSSIPLTFTTPNDCYYISFQANISAIDLDTIQVERGNPTEYTPYYAPIEMASIPNTNYKDIFVKEGETWYKRAMLGKIQVTSSMIVQSYNPLTISKEVRINKAPINARVGLGFPIGYSNRYNYVNNTWGDDRVGLMSNAGQTGTQISFRIPVSESATYLDTHETWLLYELEEAEDIEITNTTLIDQLEAIKNAISYKGQTNISQTNNDLPFILDLSALELGSDHLVINNQGNIYSKPTLDLEGSGIVDIYLNDNQILEADLTEAGEIVIDTEAMEATNPSTGLLANRQVTGDYSRIKLDPGENDLRFSGDLTKATITNYERWL